MTPPTVLILGDNRATLRLLPANSIDAVVCDPPYGLGKEPDMTVVLGHWLAGDDYEATGGGFMGKTWDSFVPGPATWREVERVLKPGGHLLAFAGSRTFDMMGLAIRLAGFEIRDGLSWLYGSGFPKSLDVSKAIDKAAGAEREVVGKSRRHGGGIVGAGTSYEVSPVVPDITAPATPAAQQWQGWGTALKPAWEPVIVARKPLVGTVAANVLAWGTGAVNVDGCRIAGESTRRTNRTPNSYMTGAIGEEQASGEAYETGSDAGRWPANVLLDETAAAMLDEQSGTTKSGQPRDDRGKGGIWSASDGTPCGPQYGDTGGASRFYYVAKPSKTERNAGLPDGNGHPTVKPVALMRWLVRLVTPPGGLVLDPFVGSGTTGIAAMHEGFGFVGLEQSQEYVTIAHARLTHHAQEHGRSVKVIDYATVPSVA